MNRSNIVRVVGIYLLLAGVGSSTLVAQQLRLVPEGDTVRVWAREQNLKKTKLSVIGWSDSTAEFGRLTYPGGGVAVPFQSITRLEHLDGKDRFKGLANGAGIGGGAGVVFGLIIGQAAVSGCQEFLCELEAFSYAGVGMLVGGVLGAVVGVENPPDRWKRVDLPVSAGFPEYRKPFHETFAFHVVSAVLGVAIVAALN